MNRKHTPHRLAMVLPVALLLAGPLPAADTGAALYLNYCAQCHGASGDGKGVNAPAMSVAPRDHTNRAEMSGRSDEELFRVIRQGGKSINQSVLMPAWAGNLTDEQIHALVRHLRVLCCAD